METYCLIKKEQRKHSPIWLGMTQKIGPIERTIGVKLLRRILKRLLERRKKRKHDSDSDSSWSIGLSSTGDLNVTSKSKRLKLYIPSSPIKTTPLNNLDTIGQTLNDSLEQTNHTILPDRKAIGVTLY